MGREEKKSVEKEKQMEQEAIEEYSSMVNHNTILLGFEGWIKYIEGFSRGLQTSKTVDSSQVMDVIGEIMEYMRTLKQDVLGLLQFCEHVLEEKEQTESNIKLLQLIQEKDKEQKDDRTE